MLKWRQARDFGDDPFDTSDSDTPRVVKLRSIAFEIACFFFIQLAFALSEPIPFLLELQLCEFFDSWSNISLDMTSPLSRLFSFIFSYPSRGRRIDHIQWFLASVASFGPGDYEIYLSLTIWDDNPPLLSGYASVLTLPGSTR
jgi:hypothetical protein